ncbi:hypothetical protein [Methylomicrobium lacus]|uniref:hypothetical protein n=1 Tax=Methylomicrobium lacus TaxID=136992 RepID=UPI0035A8FCDA
MSTQDNEKILSETTSGDLAVVGEGTPNETKISLQVLQSIYHELTGKTEDVSKSYNEPFQVALCDFQQLDHRITQCCEQYNIKAANCSAKVFYVNDSQETFSSFNRFVGFNSGSTSAVESVLITYNFMIMLPRVEKPQSYSLSVRIASRVAVEKQMRESMPFHIPKILRTMGNRTGVVTVKYVDYVVARSLLNTVDQWFEALPRAETSSVWKHITQRSHYLPIVARYIAGAFVAILIFRSIGAFIPEGASLQQLARFSLCSFVGLFAAYKLAYHLGRTAEDSLDMWSQLSYVSLTAGDKNLIREATAANKRSVIAALTKFTSALLVSAAAKVIVTIIVP